MTRISEFRALAVGAVSAIALLFSSPARADAYPIDCAILLCLSGGWPSSVECTAARAEFIRRITPWPVEPPLQVWRCPMKAAFNAPNHADFGTRIRRVAAKGNNLPSVKNAVAQDALNIAAQVIKANQADIDISDSAFDYVRSIRVWHIRSHTFRKRGSDGDCQEQSSIQLGSYGTQGDFHWTSTGPASVPSWVGLERQCNSGRFYRGVGVEWEDYEGNHDFEIVRY